MSDFLERQMSESARAHAHDSANGVDLADVTATVIGGARRRRRVRAVSAVAGAAAGFAMLAGGTVAAMAAFEDDPVAVVTRVTQDGEPSATPTPVSSFNPTPAPESETPVGGDGLSEYPPVAAQREQGFPKAYEMRDWVWDAVGDGWALESFSLRGDPYAEPAPRIPAAVIYLVSPSGARFELQELDVAHSKGLRVVSWQEESKTAHIMWEGDYSLAVPLEAGSAVFDLTTGAVDPIVFKTPWGSSTGVVPLAVTAKGNELWEAWVGENRRYYRYGGGDNWTVASINDLPSLGDASVTPRWMLAQFFLTGVDRVRADGAAVAFEKREVVDNYAYAAPSEVAIYDVDADTFSAGTAVLNSGSGAGADCMLMEWLSGDTLGYECPSGPDPSTYQPVRVPGAPASSPIAPTVQFGGETTLGLSGRVGHEQAPDQTRLWYDCGC